jgi:hypothetical protein
VKFHSLGGTWSRIAERGLEVAQPLDLGEERAGVPNGLAEPALLEEVGVERGGAGDGEVGAPLEGGVFGLGRRQQRQAELLRCRENRRQNRSILASQGKKRFLIIRLCCTDEIDDEAAVGAPACRVAEVGLAVGEARGGEVVRDAVRDEVAGVHQRVPEIEHRAVPPRRLRRRESGEQRQHREDRAADRTSRPRSGRVHPSCFSHGPWLDHGNRVPEWRKAEQGQRREGGRTEAGGGLLCWQDSGSLSASPLLSC